MAQPSTQDIVAGFDPTSYAVITGAGLLQFVDGVVPYNDKGFNVITTDVASVPQVPAANITTKWQNYIWIRRQAASVAAYVWNPMAASDPTFLQWQTITLASIADGSVTNTKIAAGAVTNDKIFSVDWSKLTSIPVGLITNTTGAGGDLTGTYPNPTIAPNAVTLAKTDPVTLGPFLCPSGGVTMFAGTVVPTGWFECNGQAISRTTYATLFAAIGTIYGNGDGASTFNLPDMRGYFPRGWDHGAGIDTARALGSTQQDKLLDHTHSSPPSSTFKTAVASAGTEANGGAGTVVLNVAATGNIAAGLGGGTETRPKNVAFMFIIKS